MQISARTSRSPSTVEATRAAASSTAPADVTHDRFGSGERKNASAGNETWVSSTSANHSSHLVHTSSASASSRPSTQNRRIIWAPTGGFPARTSRALTRASRRENAPYTLGRYVINSASSSRPSAAAHSTITSVGRSCGRSNPSVNTDDPATRNASTAEPPRSPQNIRVNPIMISTSHDASNPIMPSGP